ncbi:hypothetical protein D3C72_1401830 [compost metagenome]
MKPSRLLALRLLASSVRESETLPPRGDRFCARLVVEVIEASSTPKIVRVDWACTASDAARARTKAAWAIDLFFMRRVSVVVLRAALPAAILLLGRGHNK